ncbi:putative Peptidase M3A/M3B catalytic domain-containing protein [Seiridium cardinale]|uniref:Peptidase M3A/M3B catalytic domain-containing protein n=1 Tax=Seiridium cardinale TaxID=138064 RepID=A0ABR2XNK7_9PEZI
MAIHSVKSPNDVPDMRKLWSDVSSCAAFTQDIWRSKFAEYLRDRLTWELYRRMTLEYGGAHPNKLQMLKDVLGWEPNVDALVESLELGA